MKEEAKKDNGLYFEFNSLRFISFGMEGIKIETNYGGGIDLDDDPIAFFIEPENVKGLFGFLANCDIIHRKMPKELKKKLKEYIAG